jgi:CubicO group peptidase (beta-lactamase class C family)
MERNRDVEAQRPALRGAAARDPTGASANVRRTAAGIATRVPTQAAMIRPMTQSILIRETAVRPAAPRTATMRRRRVSFSFVLLAALPLGRPACAQGPAFPAATPESQGISADALRELAAIARGYVTDDQAVGAELLVVKNRRTVLHEAYGMADRERGVAMAPGTIFNLRSMTKMFTGAAIQALIDAGDLELDMKASDFLEGFRNEKSESITIGQLLAHRGGLMLSILMKAGRPDAYPNLIAMADAVGKAGPEFPPDSKFWYSDSGSDTLAAIVETVSGKSVAQFVSERIFAPLGMDDTFYLTKTTPHDQGRVASLYLGESGAWTRQWNSKDPPFYPYPWGSQTAFGTLEDYAKFLAMLLDHGSVKKSGAAAATEVLTNEAVERILTPRSVMTSLGSDYPFPTGFRGLTPWYGELSVLHLPSETSAKTGATPTAKPVVIGHSGSDGTDAWAFPDRDLIVLYFTQSRGGLTPVRFEMEIDRLLLHPGLADPPAPARLAPYVQRYHRGFREVDVVARAGGLALLLPDSPPIEMVGPADGRKWNAAILGLTVTFERGGADADGAVTGLTLEGGGEANAYAAGAAPPEPAIDAQQLAALVGDYREEGTTRVHRFLIEGSRLALHVVGRPAELTFHAPDEQGWWALVSKPSRAVRFERAADGSVLSCTSRIASPEQVWKRVPADDPQH